jgi:hypothetical protein
MGGVRLTKIEQLIQERFAPPSSVPAAHLLVIISALFNGDARLVHVSVGGSSVGAVRTRAFDEFVEFP